MPPASRAKARIGLPQPWRAARAYSVPQGANENAAAKYRSVRERTSRNQEVRSIPFSSSSDHQQLPSEYRNETDQHETIHDLKCLLQDAVAHPVVDQQANQDEGYYGAHYARNVSGDGLDRFDINPITQSHGRRELITAEGPLNPPQSAPRSYTSSRQGRSRHGLTNRSGASCAGRAYSRSRRAAPSQLSAPPPSRPLAPSQIPSSGRLANPRQCGCQRMIASCRKGDPLRRGCPSRARIDGQAYPIGGRADQSGPQASCRRGGGATAWATGKTDRSMRWTRGGASLRTTSSSA